MIRIHFQLFDLEPMTSGNLQKELANSFAHHSLDNPYWGLLRPNQMVARVIDALAAPPDRHAPTLQDQCCRRRHAFFIPAPRGGASKGDFS